MAPDPNFSGYVTRYGTRCTDGRSIKAHAFKHMDGQQVPLVWQHMHNSPENVLGHLILTHKDDGVWADGFFNSTPLGVQARALVEHKDIKHLSIWANGLLERASEVLHGNIGEGSLVLKGANPGAMIQNVNLQHSDNTVEVVDDEAIIYCGEEIVHGGFTTVDPPRRMPMRTQPPMPEPSGDEGSVQQVLDSMTDQQRQVMYGLIGSLQQSAGGVQNDNTTKKGTEPVTRNVFDQSDGKNVADGATLTHADANGIFMAAQQPGNTLKSAVQEYCLAHGIDSIETLFPYDQALTTSPDFITRRTEWVAGVLGGVNKTPFSRIRSWSADLTFEDARAKGYIKGNLKKEQFFEISRRITTPQTIYKKQKLDRDDMIDITDFDVVQWLQIEMRLMLDEELARAIMIGDGRDVADDDKINATNIRPIISDDPFYVSTFQVDLTDSSSSADEIVDAVVNSMEFYRGAGNPYFYTTLSYLAKLRLAKDTLGRRLYANVQEISDAMGVKGIITCEAFEAVSGLIGIIVNLSDYTVGADKGGNVAMFDFFDIDYNQNKYLIETRCSGALTKYKSALVFEEFTGAGGMLPNPTVPTFDPATGIVTIPTVSHVTYVTVASDGTESSTLSSGAQTAIAAGTTVHVRAKAASTYSFADDEHADWNFTRDSA